jgi:hypothetical protein
MIGSKLLLLLDSFSSREFRKFVEYVQSPYFNKHDRLRDFADYLFTHSHPRNEHALDRHQAFAFLFPGEDFQEQKLADLMSYLVRLAEQFLAQLHFDRDTYDQHSRLLQELASRDLHKPFQSTQRTLRRDQDKRHHRDEDFYLSEYRYWDISDKYFMRQQKRTQDESLQQKVDALDLFYLASKLKNACEMVNRQHVISQSYHFWLTDEVLAYLRHHIDEYEQHPAIVVYFHILRTLTEPDDEAHFHKLKDVLARNIDRFEREETRYMYLYVQNYIIHRINKGLAEYLPELFSLYKWLLETGIILEGNYLSQWDYKNIVSAGYRMEEYEWTEHFINTYKDSLRPEEQANAYSYNLAMLYYFKKEYKSALRVLQQVEFTDVYYALGARNILLKTYYDLRDYDPLFSLLDSFAVYLKRNKEVSAYQQKIHLSFIKLLRKLTNLTSRAEAGSPATVMDQIDQLIDKIAESKEVANYAWLHKKALALKAGERVNG